VSVVVPVYRNEDTVETLHDRVSACLAAIGETHEFVFVNDASPDRSMAVLARMADRNPDVRVVSLPENIGQNRAVLVGLSHAHGDAVVVMDADLQDPPEAIPMLLDRLRCRGGVVFAGRRGCYETWPRTLTSRAFKWLLCAVSRGRIPQDAGLFMALSRPAVRQLLAMNLPDPYVISLVARTDAPIASVPVVRELRPGDGVSSYTAGMRARTAVRALMTYLRPMRTSAHQPSGSIAFE
jgi:polyisoprenyl-phosphate glycosyltransferase